MKEEDLDKEKVERDEKKKILKGKETQNRRRNLKMIWENVPYFIFALALFDLVP